MSAPAVTGSTLFAADLVAAVAAEPSAPLHVAVGAPGGYGKTTVLRELAATWQRAGVEVVTPWQPVPAGDPGDRVVLADDAHLLDPDRLDRLRAHAERPGARIVVAYRPFPRPEGLSALVEVLRRARRPLVLPALTPARIAARIAEAGGDPTAELVAAVARETGGVPRYVARVVDASLGTNPGERIPVAALVPFAAEIDELDADLRTLLFAVEAGAGLSFDLLGALLDRPALQVAELVDAGRATGLLTADGTLVPLVRRAIAALGPIGHRIDVRQRLAGLQLARGGPVLPLMRPLLGAADHATLASHAAGELGRAYEAAGEEALHEDPQLAAQMFAAAAGAGRTTSGRQALATALAGDLDEAARLADQALGSADGEQRAAAAYVAAAVLTQRGQTAQAAAMYQWAPSGVAAGFGALASAVVGRPQAAPEPADAGPPTSLSATATLMARGMNESLAAVPGSALSTLVQAANLIEPSGPGVLLPESPAALGATVALHSAELDIADALLERAVRTGVGGALLADRHLLLRSWVLMLRGRVGEAQRSPGAELAGRQGRDRLLGTALRVGLSRRAGDLVELRSTWPDACHALLGQPVDLITLLPLGELTIAAARLGERHRVAGHLAEADLLLAGLGHPALWSTPLRWSRLTAAVVAEDRDEAERQAAALDEGAGFSPYARTVATAARQWIDLLGGRADPDAVIAAARALGGLGLVGDGARLAGQAAIRTADRKAMTLLLDCARTLQEQATGERDATTRAQVLSDREREVAALVLEGLTYKQVAGRLYLSAKTVEHHMARIRQRLGCADRAELLARLRELIGPGEDR